MRLNKVVLRHTEHCQYTEGAVQPVLLRIVWDIIYLFTYCILRCLVCIVVSCIVCIVVVVLCVLLWLSCVYCC